ncbi:putative pyridoxine 5'-phosphate oxidase superfamily flavin-nucleotide-binding protein [Rhizobium brockwellii]
MKIISSIEELNTIYGAGLSPASVTKVTKQLTPLYREMIEISPFAALATVGPEGLDCSPRGDLGGVVRVIDDETLHLPDWRGNNRVDSLSNIVRDPRLALMFLIPGSNTTMRINGRGVVRRCQVPLLPSGEKCRSDSEAIRGERRQERMHRTQAKGNERRAVRPPHPTLRATFSPLGRRGSKRANRTAAYRRHLPVTACAPDRRQVL